jgi:hypothetical protein
MLRVESFVPGCPPQNKRRRLSASHLPIMRDWDKPDCFDVLCNAVNAQLDGSREEESRLATRTEQLPCGWLIALITV